jgi:hypothetical protein
VEVITSPAGVPHYLRVARALALVSLALSPGCYQAHEREIDAGPIDAFRADVPDLGPCTRPLPCRCPTLGTDGNCSNPYLMCCPIVGPLAPPDLSSTGSRA